jgi:serine carboxypeptidase-like clade 4
MVSAPLFVSCLCVLLGSALAGQQVIGLPNSAQITDISYSGYINVDPTTTGAELFYWWFQSRDQPDKDPVVLWMTGGPGCSSELAVLFENGPFSVDDSLTLIPNPYSWNNHANVLFIDQPFGTGFSLTPKGDHVYNETVMAKYMYAFLQGWFKEYSQFQGRAFYITGESFAGHYIPALSYKIVQENQAGLNPKINFIAAAIGNGYVDPKPQYASYEPYAVLEGLVEEGSPDDQRLKTMEKACDYAMTLAYSPNATVDDVVYALDICSIVMDEVVRVAPKIDGYPINHYNIKEPCVAASLCYDFTNQEDYMNLPDTLKALGVNKTWESCSTLAGLPLTIDRIRPYSEDLPPVMDAGVRVLVYSGMWDLICDYIGGESWVNQMSWSGQANFNKVPYSNWNVNSTVAGHVRNYGLFTWLEVENAGHMVPHDQPVAALDMLTRFLANTPFS